MSKIITREWRIIIVVLYTFSLLLDIIFPPTEHELVVRSITPQKIPFLYNPRIINKNICLSDYQNKYIKAMVASCKFENNFKAAKFLGLLFLIWLNNEIDKKTLLIAVPLNKTRQKERGFNQVKKALQTMKPLSKQLEISSEILIRIKNTTPQTSLTKHARLNNLKGAFVLDKKYVPYLQKFERVIICDDVLTTGTTLLEAKNVLRPHLNSATELIGISFSH